MSTVTQTPSASAQPNFLQIAQDYNLWRGVIDPLGVFGHDHFEALPLDQRIAMITESQTPRSAVDKLLANYGPNTRVCELHKTEFRNGGLVYDAIEEAGGEGELAPFLQEVRISVLVEYLTSK